MSIYDENWYTSLKKPPLNPPRWVFGVVWPILYILMTISLVLVWTNDKCKPYCYPVTFFLIQLAFNLMWTTVFFRWKKIILALIAIFIILGLTIKTYFEFSKINKTAGYLLIPYILWLSFASYLNTAIVIIN
jgi:translocator protein